MAFQLTHSNYYILAEPEYGFVEKEDLDQLADAVVAEFPEVPGLILYLEGMEFPDEDQMELLEFLNRELEERDGRFVVVSGSEVLKGALEKSFVFFTSLDEAIDFMESEWTDRDLLDL